MEKIKWENSAGRLRYYSFSEYIKIGVQVFPDARLIDLKKSWRIAKRVIKTRARPRVAHFKEQNGWIVYRHPRIHGEEYITKTLDAMRFLYEEGTFL